MSGRNQAAAPPFAVLLGPDYAGKSSVLSAIAALPGWRVISVDDHALAPGHQLLARLRRHLVEDTLPLLGAAYSTDFALTLLQTAVVHLRDQVLVADEFDRVVVVDSYYYKILAKCRLLLGHREHPMLDWWRSFPPPERIVYLDVRPETAWRRSRWGASANPMEHYGRRPDRSSFLSYQDDLRQAMLDEVGGVPLDVVSETDDVDATVRMLTGLLGRGRAAGRDGVVAHGYA
jgi:thymidylate kinase